MVLGFHPEWIHPTAWIAPGAVVTGEVYLDEETSVWYGCVLRGDIAPIRIGTRSNIQDGTIIHVDHAHPATIGADVVVGHGAIIHGATVENGCLIAIRATVLSGAVVGTESIVGAGAVVTEDAVIPPRSLVLGVPGKVRRTLTDEEAAQIRALAERYVIYSRGYMAGSPPDDTR
ncbi:MAG: gamma carbonic anhydrase family protein [Anaerolineae bacterium]|nr:gamma carbonic anhydrase family protein [Anaerolineae bacterium]